MKASSIRSRRLALIGLGILLVAAMTYVVMRSGPLAPTRVTVVQAAEGQLTPQLFGIGTVEARRSYLIGPTTAGRVRTVVVDVGDTVKAGQPLAEMDPVDLDERTAALDASVARAGSAMAAAEAQRRDALARRELAAVNARRYVELGRQNFISTGAVEARLQEQASADALVTAAEANLAAARQDQQRLAAERAGLRQQRARAAAGLVEQRDQQVRRFDDVVIAADRQRLRVGEGLLEPRGEFVHAHGGDSGKMSAAVPRSSGDWGRALVSKVRRAPPARAADHVQARWCRRRRSEALTTRCAPWARRRHACCCGSTVAMRIPRRNTCATRWLAGRATRPFCASR